MKHVLPALQTALEYLGGAILITVFLMIAGGAVLAAVIALVLNKRRK